MDNPPLSTKLPSIQKLIDTFEWTQTALGPRDSWPSELKTILNMILGASVPMILFWGKENVTLYNNAYIPFIGSKHPALLGRSLTKIWPEQTKNFNKLVKIIYQGKSFTYISHQHTLQNPQGSLQKTETAFSPIKDHQNRVQGILGIMANISEQKKPEMQSIEQLIGGIAHDFNTLLGGIIGNLEIMNLRIQQQKTEKLPFYIEAAQQAASQATLITNQLLSFSRRQTLIPHVTNPNHTIQALTDVFQDILNKSPGRTILLDLFLDQNIWPVFCDPEQFKMALTNIFTNASESIHSIAGKISITSKNVIIDQELANQQNITPDEYAILSIQDNGNGIKPELIDRIIEPFFTTKPLGKRAGLGLSMAYGFTRQSKGYLKIRSKYLVGTTVDLFLPRYRRPMIAEKFFTDHTKGLSYKTLVIAQDSHLRTLLSETLEDLGYATTIVRTYPEAITLLSNTAYFDFLILDTRILDQYNDKQLISITQKKHPNLTLLFITGYDKTFMDLEHFMNENSFVIRQPLTYSLLTNQIKNIKNIQEGRLTHKNKL